MKLKELVEKEHSKRMATIVAKQMIASNESKQELLEIVLENVKTISQRAAYSLSIASDLHPKIYNNIHDQQILLKIIQLPNAHNSLYRNALKALFNCDLEKELEVKVMDECYKLLLIPKQKNAIIVYAIKIIAKISRPYPELQDELKRFLANLPQTPSPSIQAALRYVEDEFN